MLTPYMLRGAMSLEPAMEADSSGSKQMTWGQVTVWKEVATSAPQPQDGPIQISRAGNRM